MVQFNRRGLLALGAAGGVAAAATKAPAAKTTAAG